MKRRLKEFAQQAKILKWVPNTLTLCNSLCGFAAILYMLKVFNCCGDTMATRIDVFCVSSWIILFAMLFDATDGFAARLFNAASLTGLQMDSLSDMVTFGVAPALLVAVFARTMGGLSQGQTLFVYGCCAVYLSGAALRLAIYNVHAMVEHKSSDTFSGLPSPGAAAAVCCVVLGAKYFDGSWNFLAFALPCYAAVLGLLMVSGIPYTHMAKWCFAARHRPGRILLILVAFFLVAMFQIPAVAALITLYILSGPALLLWHWLANRKNKPETL